MPGGRGTVAPMPDREQLRDLVARALAEDLGAGDITSEATVPADARANARIVQKQPGVVFGLGVATEAFAQAGARASSAIAIEGEWRDSVPADVARVSGPARALLAAERTALNLLCHLSGVATLTARFVDAVAGTGAAILDTRKTTRGCARWRRRPSRAGGGRNHRMGLHDAVLIKENHVALAGRSGRGRAAAPARPSPSARSRSSAGAPTEIEEALGTGADRLLLDNMDPARLRAAVAASDGPRSRTAPSRPSRPRAGSPWTNVGGGRRHRRRLRLGRRPHPLRPRARPRACFWSRADR